MTTQVTERYCPGCGKPAADATHNRFGEWCAPMRMRRSMSPKVRAEKQRKVAGADRPHETMTRRMIKC